MAYLRGNYKLAFTCMDRNFKTIITKRDPSIGNGKWSLLALVTFASSSLYRNLMPCCIMRRELRN